MMQLSPIFSSFLALDVLDVDLNAIEQACYELKRADSGRQFSNDGGYQSNNISLDSRSPFAPLLLKIDAAVNQLHASLMLKKNFGQKIDNAWININNRGGHNIPHVHPRACFSGVFYVRAPADCGELILRNPASSLEHVITEDLVGQYNAFTSPVLRIAPEAGKLVIFPSWILHFVRANQADADRISLAFNTVFQRRSAAA
jgi:uncharacterized protein (TIGR02466 family)